MRRHTALIILVWLYMLVIVCLIGAHILLYNGKDGNSNSSSLHGRNLADYDQRPPSRHRALTTTFQDVVIPSQPSSADAATDTYTNPPAHFLLGIFTIAEERSRRSLIRSAFAMYNDTRLCSFGSTNDQPMLSPPSATQNGCELFYTFVIGANPKGDTQLVLDHSASPSRGTLPLIPLITTPPPGFDTTLEPNDITFLNIQVCQARPHFFLLLFSHLPNARDHSHAIYFLHH